MSGEAFVWVGIQEVKGVVVVNERERERAEAVRLIGCQATAIGGGREGGRSEELSLTTDNPFLHNVLSSQSA